MDVNCSVVRLFLVIIDKLRTELEKRNTAYQKISQLFAFLTKLSSLTCEESQGYVANLLKVYTEDLDDDLKDEMTQFIFYVKNVFGTTNQLPIHLLEWMVDQKITDVFPNVYIVLRIFLSIPISNCSGERSFSKLSFIENKYRTSMNQLP